MIRGALLAAALAACGDDAGVCPRAEPIIGGVLDTEHDAVVQLRGLDGGATCSGVLVAPGVVLTASHCVWGDASALEVVFGDDATTPSAVTTPVEIVPYPGATGEEADLEGGVDLAALVLADDAPVPPLEVDLAGPAGGAVTIVGYGTDFTSSGVRRRVDVPVERTCARLLVAGDSTANACTGDSGGAVLADERLIAIVSHGVAGCTGPSKHTRLDVHRAWIETLLAGEPATACDGCLTPDPTCADDPPDAGC